MALSLPPSSHPARNLFDVSHLVTATVPENRHLLKGYVSAKASALAFLKSNPKAKSVTSLVFRANGNLQLITFGPRGGSRLNWDFGKL